MSEVYCGAEPCPVILSSTCVFYRGQDLLYIGVNANDNLQIVIEKINQAFQNTGIGYAFTNGVVQPAPNQPVQLGGALVQNTTIGGNYTLTFVGNLQAAKHITTGGAASQFVKGDGSLDNVQYQPAGNYLTGLSGDGTVSGPGVGTLVLTTVNFAPGTFGNGSTIPVVTVNSKGLVTNVTPTPIVIPPQPLTFIGDVVGSGLTGTAVTLSLQNVNNNIYNTNTPLKFAVNAKGLVTSASPITQSDINSILGYTPVPDSRTLTINGVTYNLSANRSWVVTNQITLTTTGNNGPATWNQLLGALNIPEYTLSGLGGVPATRTLTINGTTYDLSLNRSWTVGDLRSDSTYNDPAWLTGLNWSKILSTPTTLSGYGITDAVSSSITLTINGVGYDLSTNRSWTVGTVTSVGLSAPVGFVVSNSPVTGAGTLTLSFDAGYSLPTTAKQADWDTAYASRITSLTTVGNSGSASLVSNVLNIPTYTLAGLGGVPDTRTINGLALSSNQTFATGTVGTDFNIVSVGTVHTFNIPDASPTNRGLINAVSQTIGGTKTFTNSPIVPSLYLANMGAGSGAVYYNVSENRLTLANYNVGGEIKFEVNGGVYTMTLNSDLTIELMGYTTDGFLKTSGGNGLLIVDTTTYTPTARTLTINGIAYDLSVDRTWSVGTVTSVGLSVPTGFSVTNTPVTTSGTLALSFASGYSLPTNASQTNWDTAYSSRISSLTTTGTSGAATLIGNVLNIPQYQAQGNYITSLTGEATASGPGAASVTLTNSAVIGKVLTGLTVTSGAIASTDSILSAFGKIQGQINALVGGLQYQGVWDASTNTPTITSGVGTDGYFYIINVAGNTNIDGNTGWQVGDWIVFDGTVWQKVDNTDSVTSVNGFTGAVVLTTTDISEGTNLYYTNSRARQAISLTTTGSSGAATYSNLTGVLNIPQYTLSGLGGVPTTRTLTINGTAYDLSANRSWSVGTVTSIATSGPITGGTITGSGTIGITQATSTTNGYLSSTDWNTFNNKQNAITLTVTGSSGPATLVGATLNIPEYTISGLGGVPSTRTLTINGTSYDLSANRTWSVGTVTSITFSSPLTGGTITGSGTVGITQSSGSTDGYLSSTDWTTFNNKANANGSNASGTWGINITGNADTVDGFHAAQTYTSGVNESGSYLGGHYSSGGTEKPNSNTFNAGKLKLAMLSNTNLGFGGSWNDVLWLSSYTGGDVKSSHALVFDKYSSDVWVSDQNYDSSSWGTGYKLWTTANLSNPVTGTGNTNYLAKFTSNGSTIGNSQVFDNGTNVGIGTNSPSVKLHVQDTSNQNPSLLILDGSNTGRGLEIKLAADGLGANGSAVIYNTRVAAPYGEHIWQQAGTQRMRLDNNGNLGLGVTPSAADSILKYLEVGNAGNSFAGFNGGSAIYLLSGAYYNAGWKYAVSSSGVNRYDIGNGSYAWFTAPSGTAGQAISFTQAMTLFSTGNLLVGTPSPISDNGAKLQVSGTATIARNDSANISLTISNAFINQGNLINFQHNSGGTTTNAFIGHGGDSTGNLIFINNSIQALTIARSTGATTFSSTTFSVAKFNSTYGQVNIDFQNSGTTFSSIGSGVSVTSTAAADDTGIGTAGLNKNIVFATGTSYSERMRITSAGNVGIGTNNPIYKLVVSNSGGTGLEIDPGTIISNRNILISYNRSTSSYSQIQIDASLTVLGNQGNVLIGTTSDNGAKLQVSGNATATRLLLGTSTASSYRISIVANSSFDTSGILMQDTNIGGRTYAIGSSITTVGNFELYDATAASTRFSISSTGAATFSGSVFASDFLGTSDRLYIPGNRPVSDWFSSSLSAGYSQTNSYAWVNGAGSLVLGTNGSERLRIFSGGNVHIGSSPSSDNGAKLQVSGDVTVNTSGQARLISTFHPSGADGQNIWIGGGGQSSTNSGGSFYGSFNTSVGVNALLSNTSGYDNSAFGKSALNNNTSGYYNSAFGFNSLFVNTSGYANSSFGLESLTSNTTGYYNSAFGSQSIYSNTTGHSNSSFGLSSLFYNTTGFENTAIGMFAGAYTKLAAFNQTSNKSVYLGYDSRSGASGNSNEIVIGYGAIGQGSNSAVIGNSNITKTILRGDVLINTETPITGANLNVNGAIRTEQPTGTTADNWRLGRPQLATSSTPEDVWIRVQIGTKIYDILAIDRGTA